MKVNCSTQIIKQTERNNLNNIKFLNICILFIEQCVAVSSV